MPAAATFTSRRLRVRGRVQGVGFRPFVHRLAASLQLTGLVRNDHAGVSIVAEGPSDVLDVFTARLRRDAPPAARIDSIDVEDGPLLAKQSGFTIAPSECRHGNVDATLPVDLAPCPDCRRELTSAVDRRRAYPFINCTQCGPRYSIIDRLPYDRANTTMHAFTQCPDCAQEYGTLSDRRHHAEPNACPVCGPKLRLWATDTPDILAHGPDALDGALTALRAGRIVAVKGVGGYHLLVDATNDDAVRRLRDRKHRAAKPLAVLFASLDSVRVHAAPTVAETRALESTEAPIVLARRRSGSSLSPAIAPGNPWIGALLPPSPLHLLLATGAERPLVATSGNLSDEPLCTSDAEAQRRLGGIADVFLAHNREIAHPVDDAVVRYTTDQAPIVLRLGRGYAPNECRLPVDLAETTACLGGQIKNAVALAAGDRCVLSPHIGDLDGADTYDAFRRTLHTLSTLARRPIERHVHDKHPDYASTAFAREAGLPTLAVQHHLAHVLAVLLEHQHPAHDVLGFAWDGTGFGEDDSIWGGEAISLRNGRAVRFARLRPFRLPGGDAAVRDARRTAFSVLQAVDTGIADTRAREWSMGPHETQTIQALLSTGLRAPWCSSMGRLFDAAAVVLGVGHRNKFEGELPLGLEIAADSTPTPGASLPFPVSPLTSGAHWEIDWRPAFAALLQPGQNTVAAADGFHRGLVESIVTLARHAQHPAVVLSGGCFQNARLCTLATRALEAAGFRVLCARQLPANDGAIAAGQALAAALHLHSVHLPHP